MSYATLGEMCVQERVAIARGSADAGRLPYLGLQHIESEADDLMTWSLDELYHGDHSAVRIVYLKDLYELLERVFDRCRDVGNLVFHIVLKHS